MRVDAFTDVHGNLHKTKSEADVENNKQLRVDALAEFIASTPSIDNPYERYEKYGGSAYSGFDLGRNDAIRSVTDNPDIFINALREYKRKIDMINS